MIRAIAICSCNRCGSEFKKTANKQTPKAAKKWVYWAEQSFTLCSDCKIKQLTEDTTRFIGGEETGTLPILTGSRKQILPAHSIRRSQAEHICSHKAAMQAVIDITQEEKEKEYMILFLKEYNQVVNSLFEQETKTSWWLQHKEVSELNQILEAEVLERIKKKSPVDL